jgi:hypothetical protein
MQLFSLDQLLPAEHRARSVWAFVQALDLEPFYQAAAERAARERKERVEEALRQHEQLSRQREQRKQGDGETTRVSTTDPDARKMKMANGGYDPASNVQFATDGDARVIVGVDVTNDREQKSKLPPWVKAERASAIDSRPRSERRL